MKSSQCWSWCFFFLFHFSLHADRIGLGRAGGEGILQLNWADQTKE